MMLHSHRVSFLLSPILAIAVLVLLVRPAPACCTLRFANVMPECKPYVYFSPASGNARISGLDLWTHYTCWSLGLFPIGDTYKPISNNRYCTSAEIQTKWENPIMYYPAEAQIRYYEGTIIIEGCTIRLQPYPSKPNGDPISWENCTGADCQPSKMNVNRALRHEMGHCMGADDLTGSYIDVMKQYTDEVDFAEHDWDLSLTKDDIACPPKVYPADSMGAIGGYDMYHNPYCAHNIPAVLIGDFTVENGMASVVVADSSDTRGFRLYGRNTIHDRWCVVVDSIPPALGPIVCSLPTPTYNDYLLTEIRQNGDWALDAAFSAESVSKTCARAHKDNLSLASTLSSLKKQSQLRGAKTGLPGCWIITTHEFVQLLTDYYIPIWDDQYDVSIWEVVPDYANPEEVRQTIREFIDAKASAAGGGVKYFMLVGDATDYDEIFGSAAPSLWTGQWAGSRETIYGDELLNPPQDEYYANKLPAWVMLNPPSTDYFRKPYFLSDLPYANTDGDANCVPDVVVSRIPVRTEDELAVYLDHLMRYRLERQYVDGSVSIMENSYDLNVGNSEIQVLGSFKKSLAMVTPSWASVRPYSRSAGLEAIANGWTGNDIPVQVAELWNYCNPDVLICYGTVSSRDSWAKMVSHDTLDNLSTARLPVAICLSCNTADFYGYGPVKPLNSWALLNDAMFGYDNRGVIGLFGALAATWQQGNEAVASRALEALLGNPGRPMAESFQLALRGVMTDYAGNDRIMATARVYEYLGDVLMPVMTYQPGGTGVVESVDEKKLKIVMSPNPGNGSISIRWEDGTRGNGVVVIYTLRGEVVRRMQCDASASGVIWDTRDERGREVASGVYLVRAVAGVRSVMGKVTISR